MKKYFVFVLVLIISQALFAQDVPTKLDELLSVYAKQEKLNGTVLVSQGDKVLLNKGYGYRDVANKIPNDSASIYQIGSITKQFTAAIILKLQEQKKLSIEDKLSRYFPGYPKADSITIKNLLSHTSGIYNYTNDPAFMANEVTKPHSRKEMVALFENKPFRFPPGSSWEYSNSAYMLLGYIIEDVTKDTYYNAVRKIIFQPVQMTHSGFDFTHLVSKEKAIGYSNANEAVKTPAPIVDSSVSYAAGAIYSTTGDLYKWYRALKSDQVITTASRQLATTPIQRRYALGLSVDSISGKQRLSHGGGIHGFVTNMSMVPEDGICIVILNNASNTQLNAITQKIYAILYNQPYEIPKERIAVTLDEAVLKQYEGEYELAPDFKFIISVKSGKLMLKPTGQSEAEIYAEKKDFFFAKVVDAQIEFKRNAANEVESLVLYQNGREMPGKKTR